MSSLNSIAAGVTLGSALSCGLMAGVFFAFSTFIMKALARLPVNEGIAAMQSVNVAAVNSWFLAVFLATSATSVFVVIWSLRRWHDSSAFLLLAGAATYLIGSFLVTVIFNVPLNQALASLPPESPDRAARWAAYLAAWTTWNHVRTAASLAAAALQIIGLL